MPEVKSRLDLIDYLKQENEAYRDKFNELYQQHCDENDPFFQIPRHDLDSLESEQSLSLFERGHALSDLINRLEEHADESIAEIFKEWRKSTSYNSYKMNSELFKEPNGKHPVVKAVNKAARK